MNGKNDYESRPQSETRFPKALINVNGKGCGRAETRRYALLELWRTPDLAIRKPYQTS